MCTLGLCFGRVTIKLGSQSLEPLPGGRGIEALRCVMRHPADLLVTFTTRFGAQHVSDSEDSHGHEFHFSSLLRAEETAALAAVAATAPPRTPSVILVSRLAWAFARPAAAASIRRSHLLLRLNRRIVPLFLIAARLRELRTYRSQ